MAVTAAPVIVGLQPTGTRTRASFLPGADFIVWAYSTGHHGGSVLLGRIIYPVPTRMHLLRSLAYTVLLQWTLAQSR